MFNARLNISQEMSCRLFHIHITLPLCMQHFSSPSAVGCSDLHRAMSRVSKHTTALCFSELVTVGLWRHLELYIRSIVHTQLHTLYSTYACSYIHVQHIPVASNVLQLHIKAPVGMRCLLKDNMSYNIWLLLHFSTFSQPACSSVHLALTLGA